MIPVFALGVSELLWFLVLAMLSDREKDAKLYMRGIVRCLLV